MMVPITRALLVPLLGFLRVVASSIGAPPLVGIVVVMPILVGSTGDGCGETGSDCEGTCMGLGNS